MAFDIKGFQNLRIDATDLPKDFQYKSDTDTLATINTEGYFNSEDTRLRVHDAITVIDSAGVRARLIVNKVDNGVVDTTDGDVVSATDTD